MKTVSMAKNTMLVTSNGMLPSSARYSGERGGPLALMVDVCGMVAMVAAIARRAARYEARNRFSANPPPFHQTAGTKQPSANDAVYSENSSITAQLGDTASSDLAVNICGHVVPVSSKGVVVLHPRCTTAPFGRKTMLKYSIGSLIRACV